MQFISGLCGVQYFVCFINLGLAGFMSAYVFSEDIMKILRSINQQVKDIKSEAEVKKQLIVFIDMYSDAKELSALEVHTTCVHAQAPPVGVASKLNQVVGYT